MKIGLTYTGFDIKHQNYVNWLKAGNSNIDIVTLSVKENNLAGINNCDALVLSGGVDMQPGFYGNGQLDYENAPAQFQPERDEFEAAAFNSAIKNNIAVLGICRGFQLINCILGGNLKQDLGSQNKIHWGEKKPYDKAHAVTVESNTLFAEITLKERMAVNSAHHQAIDKLGEELMINCRADDGTIEGFEWKNKSNRAFLLGVQWHPERMFQFQLEGSVASKNIRDHFIAAIKKQQHELHNN